MAGTDPDLNGDDLPEGPADGVINVAEEAAWAVVNHLSELFPLDDDDHEACLRISGYSDGSSAGPNSVAKLIRSIGLDRATPAVIGQQLKIDGHLQTGELTPAQTLVAKVFAVVLAEVDAFEKDWAERNKPDSEPEERRAVPIEDTNLETVDDPMATWGGR